MNISQKIFSKNSWFYHRNLKSEGLKSEGLKSEGPDTLRYLY